MKSLFALVFGLTIVSDNILDGFSQAPLRPLVTAAEIGATFSDVTYTSLKQADLAKFIKGHSHIPDFMSKADDSALLNLKVDKGDSAEMVVADARNDLL